MTTPYVPPPPGASTGPPLPPPAWYADPWQRAALRWWDGARWTGHVWPPAAPPSWPPAPPSASRPPSAAWPPSASWPPTVAWPPAPPMPATGDATCRPRFPGRAFWPSVGWMLLAVLASIACAIPVVVAVALAGGGESGAGTAAVAVSYPVLFGAMWWFSRRLSRRYGTGDMGRDYGWRRFRKADIGWGVLAGFGALVAQGIVGSIFKPDDSGYRDAVVGKHPSVLLLVLMGLATVVGAPLFEELMFRGPIMQSLLSRLGEWGGVVVQGVVFALYHVTGAPQLITLWYLTPLFVVGVIFGFAAHRTGRLATSQIAHATMNTLAYLALLASL